MARAEIVEGVEGHPAFGDAALAAARTWTFKPGEKDGEPVEMAVHVPVKFRLDEKKPPQEK